jgi:hypothetical protein
VADEVHYLVVESGAHEIDGTRFEAWTMEATVPDRKRDNDAYPASYLQSYQKPVVVGQVMTMNDSRWSVFWARGSSRQAEPTASVLRVGRHIGEDRDHVRLPETIGVIVFEEGVHTLGGVTVQAFLTPDEVEGIGDKGDDHTKVDFLEDFFSPPKFAVLSGAGEDGGDMGFPVLSEKNPLHADHHIHVAIDEDRINDADRWHTTERIAVIAFEDAPGQGHRGGADIHVVMVVDDADSMDSEDEDRRDILQSFGMSVTLIDKDESTSATITKLEAADVVYISSKSNASAVQNIIDDMDVPVVNEHLELIDDLGFASGGTGISEKHIEILDNGHPITAGFSLDAHLDIVDEKTDNLRLTGSIAPGARILADEHGHETGITLAVLDIGDERLIGGPSPSRRVQLPWGESDFEPDELTSIGKELLREALIWAANQQGGADEFRVPPRLIWHEPES